MTKKRVFLIRKNYLRTVKQEEIYYAGGFSIYSGGKKGD